MPVLRRVQDVPAPPRLVAGILRDPDAAVESLGRVGLEFRSSGRLLVAGDEVEVGLRGLLGRVSRCRTRITRVGVGGMWSELVSGPAADIRHATTVGVSGDVTRVVDELRWAAPFGVFGRGSDPLLRPFADRVLDARAAVLAERAATLGEAPVVVGAAVVRDGRLLAARRAHPPELAGRWELPGGAVEPGETEPEALRRELHEELGTSIEVLDRIGTDLPIDGRVLRIHHAALRPDAPEPVALQHRELRWVGAAEVAGLGWLDADRAVLTELLDLLRASSARSSVPDR